MREPITLPATPIVTAPSTRESIELLRRRLVTSCRLRDDERDALEVVIASACERLEDQRTRRAG